MATELLCPWAPCLRCGTVKRATDEVLALCCDDPFVIRVLVQTPEEPKA